VESSNPDRTKQCISY